MTDKSSMLIDAMDRFNMGDYIEIFEVVDYLQGKYNVSKREAEEIAFMAEADFSMGDITD